ncbi:MAG: dTDP-4-dehydrorhamnose 3,5-epimerase [Phycisphaeraceae bacterium]|nr:dTDP-4-dehydrorhamnose 3,5-epimerase [Phycisphaeraceae bacterium]
MDIQPLDIPDLKLISPKKFGDARGFFSEVWSRRTYESAGINCDFVQDNHSLSAEVGTVRGLHFQSPPAAQAKLVRCIHGRVLDIVVDLRVGSPTFGKHIRAVLDADNWQQLFIPVGFAHGFVTLLPDSEVLYKVDQYYSPENDGGVLWCDSELGIDWGVAPDKAVVSAKDAKLPAWRDFKSPFTYKRSAM